MRQISEQEFDPLPMSLLNDHLFCNRRAGLKIVEGFRRANAHTAIGDVAHEHADLPGYEIAKGARLLRALPVWSEQLGLIGKCDIVEEHRDGSLMPVEYKKGKRRTFENDDAQVCAQALCLEEMLQCRIERGAVYHAATKRRREVELTAELRALTEKTAAALHALFSNAAVPPAVLKPQCAECSLYEVCLPELTSNPLSLERAARGLFATA